MVINQGYNSNVDKHQIFTVSRMGEYIAQIEIFNVSPSRAAGRILTRTMKQEIKVGDNVLGRAVNSGNIIQPREEFDLSIKYAQQLYGNKKYDDCVLLLDETLEIAYLYKYQMDLDSKIKLMEKLRTDAINAGGKSLWQQINPDNSIQYFIYRQITFLRQITHEMNYFSYEYCFSVLEESLKTAKPADFVETSLLPIREKPYLISRMIDEYAEYLVSAIRIIKLQESNLKLSKDGAISKSLEASRKNEKK